MATKIISKGTDTYNATCLECGTVFTYEREDVHACGGGGGEYVPCPHCGERHRHTGVRLARARRWGNQR